MVGYQEGTTTVLASLPTPPPHFRNLSNPLAPGVYLLGHTHMTARDFHITSIWHRALGPSDDLILGVLSVFVIAVLSEIVTAVILRTRNRNLPSTHLRTAYALEHLSHLRGLRPPFADSRSRTTALLVLVLAAFLFAIDVVVVLLTQPSFTESHRFQYGLQAVQPVTTSRGRSRFIRRITGDRPCVTPFVTNALQRRNFAIAACIRTDFHEPSPVETLPADNITIASWYHQAGSDHNVTFPNGFYSVSIRATLYVDADQGAARRILFTSADGFDHALYLQELVMYGAMEWACNTGPGRPTRQAPCAQLVNSYSIVSRQVQPRRIVLWRGKTKDEISDVPGLVTTFRVPIDQPYRAINSGIRALVTSAAIFEVDRPTAYAKIADDDMEDGVDGLISEEGRLAGVVLMSTIFGCLIFVMLLLRFKLRPTTLGTVAYANLGHEPEIILEKDQQLRQQDRCTSFRRDPSFAFREYDDNISEDLSSASDRNTPWSSGSGRSGLFDWFS